MPARAVGPRPPGHEPHASLAPVVNLAAYRDDTPPAVNPMPDDDLARRAARHWQETLHAAGMDFETPQPPARVMKVMAAELERLATALVYVREGGGPNQLPADPDSGVDLDSAVEFVGLLRDMGAAPEVCARTGSPRRR